MQVRPEAGGSVSFIAKVVVTITSTRLDAEMLRSSVNIHGHH